jgi:hypothetical protein
MLKLPERSLSYPERIERMPRIAVFFLFGVIIFYTLYIMTKGSTGKKTDYSYRALHGQPPKTQTDFSYRHPRNQPKVQADFSYHNIIPIPSNRTEASATQKKLTAGEFAEKTGLSGTQLDEEYADYVNAYKDYEDNGERGQNPTLLLGPRPQYKRYRARTRKRTRARAQKRTRSRGRTRAHRLR